MSGRRVRALRAAFRAAHHPEHSWRRFKRAWVRNEPFITAVDVIPEQQPNSPKPVARPKLRDLLVAYKQKQEAK